MDYAFLMALSYACSSGVPGTPEAAADDVFTQHTDCNLWDRIEAPSDTPSCLREWQWISDPQ